MLRSNRIWLALRTATVLIASACSTDRLMPTGVDAATRPRASIAASGFIGATVALRSQLGLNLCADIAEGGDGPPPAGTRVQVWTCHGLLNQRFVLQPDGRITAYGGVYCLDVAGGVGADGDPVIVWPCNGGSNQRWERTDDDELRTAINGKCLDVQGAEAADGAKLLVYTCHGGENQRWTGVRVADPPGIYYVTPDAPSSGDGTAERPWSLADALADEGGIPPGSTIWLRGGTYSGHFASWLTGLPGAPIIVREYPGERATIDGTLVVDGAYATFWGFESMSSAANPPDVSGISVDAPGVRLVNLVVHDHGGNGIFISTKSPGSEVYGSVLYNNGRQTVHEGHAHGIYAQNEQGTLGITDNVLFNQFGYGLHLYAEEAALRGFHVEGNAVFESGRPASTRGAPEILVGGGQPAERVALVGNMTYKSSDDGTNTQLGYPTVQNRDATFRDNYIAGGKPAFRLLGWATADVSGNTFQQVADWEMIWIEGATDGVRWAHNAYWRAADDDRSWWVSQFYDLNGFRGVMHNTTDVSLGATATGTRVFVRPNRYEPGRANVVVYNWSRAGAASADLTGVLAPGDRYEVRNVRDVYGSAVAAGTYQGGTISIPISAVPDPTPVGGFAGAAPTSTTEFQTYVVRRVGG